MIGIEHFAAVFALLGAVDDVVGVEIPIHVAHFRGRQAKEAIELLRLNELIPMRGLKPCGLLVERLVGGEMNLKRFVGDRTLIEASMVPDLNVPNLAIGGE